MRNLWLAFFHPLSAHFRRKRFAALLREAPDLLTGRVLDVGGSIHFWQKVGVDIEHHAITIINIAVDGQSTDIKGQRPADTIQLYDGRTIPWPDKHFDWVLCNSVIEHVPPQERKRFSEEIQRVGTNYIVQTPAYGFPVEPHFVMPVIHWLPRSWGRRIAGYGVWGLLRRRRKEDIQAYFDEVHLLKLREFRDFFPGAKLIVERFLGLPKSYVLIGKTND